MMKMVHALTVLAKERHHEVVSLHLAINESEPGETREMYKEAFYTANAKYKATVRELCDTVRLAEAMAEEETPVDQLVSAAHLAITLKFSTRRVYDSIVEAIDFVFDKTLKE